MSELPHSWALAELQDITEISPKFNGDVEDDALVHFVPMAAVAEDFGGIDVSQLRPLSEVRKGYTSFAEGDVLFAKITPCMENGKGGLVPRLTHDHAFGSTEFHVTRPSAAISGEWLAHFLSQPDFRKLARHNMTGTAGQLRVPTKWLQTVALPVPPRAEQTRIVEKLESLLADLDAGVAELKAAQRKLAQYRQSLLKAAVEGALTADWRANTVRPERSAEGAKSKDIAATSFDSGPAGLRSGRTEDCETGAQLLQRILRERRARFEHEHGNKKKYKEPAAPDTSQLPELPRGWVWATIEQLSLEQRYGSSAKTNTDSHGVPVIRMGNIQNGDLDLAELKYLPADHDEFPELHLQDGDMLFNRTNSPELVGKTAVYRSQIVPCSYASYLISVRFTNLFVPELASTYINSAFGRSWVKSVVVQQVGQANVNGTKLAALPLPLPPLEEQHQITAQLNAALTACKDQEHAIAHALKQAAAQRRNLLRAAFSGQLVPQDPADEPASALLARIRAAKADNTDTGKRKPRTGRRK